MQPLDDRPDDQLIESIDASHRSICEGYVELFALIRECDRRKLWEMWEECHCMAQWVSLRYGIGYWKAERWVDAAHALPTLPRIAAALARGDLSVDKVVELSRFATADTEEELVAWAEGVSPGRIRRKGDLLRRQSLEEVENVASNRTLDWWFSSDGRSFGLEAWLPAAEGAIVARAIERVAAEVSPLPGEEDPFFADQRRADALVELCGARLGADPDPDRATVVIHVEAASLGEFRGASVEGGGVIPEESVRRLLCTSRVQALLEDEAGTPIRLGRVRREPSAWMLRQLRRRDDGCVFPGCEARRFTQAHHVSWWEQGGHTDLENLVLLCGSHHKLVHEFHWRVKRDREGTVRWFRSDGSLYLPRSGPGPPQEAVA